MEFSDFKTSLKEKLEKININVNDTQVKKFYDYMNLLSVIDQRCLRGKCNIFTSNYSLDELQTMMGDRLISRVNKNSIVVELIGQDKRGGDITYVNG